MPTRPLITSYEADQRLLPDFWHKVGATLLILAALAFPIVADAHWLGMANDALIAIVGAVSLMILTGFCGQISLGHAAFLGLGAYTAGILGTHLQLPFWLNMVAAGFISTAIGLAVGPFALRLRGLYLAIVTVGLIFIVQHLLMTLSPLTRGAAGLPVPMFWGFGSAPDDLGDFGEPWEIAGMVFDQDEKLYLVFFVVTAIVVLMGTNIRRSRSGRAMMAVRDQDLAAAVLGVNPASTKVVAFAVSSFLAGVAGAMYAFKAGHISIRVFDLGMSVHYVAIIVLGGIGTIFGAVWGALAFILLEPLAELVGGVLPGLSSNQQSTLVLASLLIAFLIFEPMGLVGIWLRIKRYFLAWPFRY